jgi:hypothetical protein
LNKENKDAIKSLRNLCVAKGMEAKMKSNKIVLKPFKIIEKDFLGSNPGKKPVEPLFRV